MNTLYFVHSETDTTYLPYGPSSINSRVRFREIVLGIEAHLGKVDYEVWAHQLQSSHPDQDIDAEMQPGNMNALHHE